MSINNLTSSSLTINQQLLIPKEKEIIEPGNIEYSVESGDNLWDLANKFDTTVDAIKKLNNLTSNNLSIGQKLIIPAGEVEVIEEPAVGGVNYIVQKGDNLYSIANKYNTTIDAIKKANNLSSNLLQIGQVILIPGTTEYATYSVKSGDTLYGIASKYNTTVSQLKTINNLESNNLSIGQKLLIPSS